VSYQRDIYAANDMIVQFVMRELDAIGCVEIFQIFFVCFCQCARGVFPGA